MTTYRLKNPPVLGRTEGGDTVYLGGFSSLVYAGRDPQSSNPLFFTNTDRGPNADEIEVRGRPARPFALPAFQPEILKLELVPGAGSSDGSILIRERIPLRLRDGTPLSGLPNSENDEIALDLSGRELARDPNGCDSEGLALAPGGAGEGFWIAEEYGPSLLEIGPDGIVRARHAMPREFGSRKHNRGFEGLTREGDKLFAILQSPLLRGKGKAGFSEHLGIRILEWDIAAGGVSGVYLYHPGGAASATKIGDIESLGGGRFLVLEQNGEIGEGKAIQKIFEIDLAKATDISGLDDSGWEKPIEAMTEAELDVKGLRPARRRLKHDLAGLGFAVREKFEGIAALDDGSLAIVNDNDFGLAGGFDPATGRLEACSDPVPTEIRILSF